MRALGVPCDVATAEGTATLVAATEQAFGGADILVNNAGTGSNETIMEAPDAKWQHYWDLHVMAAVRLARGLVPAMRRRGGGVILNNASICASQPLWYEPIYNVTKAALVMFSKTLANEVIKDNIRVNAINPGLVLTPDWVKTAKQLTEGRGGDYESLPPERRRRARPDPTFRHARGDGRLLRLPVLRAGQLLGGFDLFRRWRDAEDALTGSVPYPHQPCSTTPSTIARRPGLGYTRSGVPLAAVHDRLEFGSSIAWTTQGCERHFFSNCGKGMLV